MNFTPEFTTVRTRTAKSEEPSRVRKVRELCYDGEITKARALLNSVYQDVLHGKDLPKDEVDQLWAIKQDDETEKILGRLAQQILTELS